MEMECNIKSEENDESDIAVGGKVQQGPPCEIRLETPIGPVKIDAREAKRALDEANKGKGRQLTLAQASVEGHLGGVPGSISKYWPRGLGEKVMTVLGDYLEGCWNTDNITRFTMRGMREEKPSYWIVPTGESSSVDVPIEATRMISSKTEAGRRLVLENSVDCDGDIRLCVLFNEEDRSVASDLLGGLEDFFFENGPLRGKVFDSDLRFMPRNSGASEKIILPTGVEKLVDRHLTGFLSLIDRLEGYGISSNKGVILSGPPGTGKTLLVRSIIENCEMTTICLSPEKIKRNTISQVYRAARKLSPCLVVLEDIDSAGGIHRKISDHPILGEVLQALDGIEDNAGVVTLATTNYLENIDDALRDRPGRIERIITIPVPDAEARVRLISRLAEEFGIGDWLDPGWLAGCTEGFTGDWLRNLMQTSRMISLQGGREEVVKSDIEEALGDIEENRMVAYKSTPELPRPMVLAKETRHSYA